MDFKILAVGDVVGTPGVDRICRSLRQLQDRGRFSVLTQDKGRFSVLTKIKKTVGQGDGSNVSSPLLKSAPAHR